MENSIEELQEKLETLHATQDARLACNADDLDIREEIAEVEEEIKELQDDISVDREDSIKNEWSSMEENIKILEELIENANIENMDMNDCFGGEHIEAIERFLSNYKRVLKENEELKFKERSRIIGKYGDAEIHDVINRTLSNDYIPVQKVKDKIEEYKNMLKTCNKVKDIDRIKAINERILELQELLEGRR